ncbi:uncharacterized protein LOC108745023 [Agrilus planipennis]|uniref:Uncharacterized protein LOC108745023 n=1 Tax=Agrilus planipennis TaxID=224129 RepID=A0A1W4XUS3_AGRPL|nr:uncharacterized protein LOC108745023 [Agrilus planipennis]
MNVDDEDVIEPLKERVLKTSYPNMSNDFIKANRNREIGQVKGCNIKASIEAFAEDELVRKEYKELKCEVPGTPRSTFLMVFSPDGSKVASTHGDHNIYVTDLRTGKNIKTLIGHPRTPWCIAFHPTSNDLVASGCLAGQVRIWDLSGGSEVWISKKGSVISSIAFHPIDRLVVIATFHELFFWDWSKPEPFLQTSTANVKEKVRYVAFDKLGHKLITGIANNPQSRWERNRVSESSGSPYRRRFPRVGIPFLPQPTSSTNSNTTERAFTSTVPERERRITACYRNLVHEYELLVQRYLQIYRPPTTMDRGTDPMDMDQQQPSTSTSSGLSTSLANDYQEPGPSSATSSGPPPPPPPPPTAVVTTTSSSSSSSSSSSESSGIPAKYRVQEHAQRGTQTITPTRVKLSPKRRWTEQGTELHTGETRKRKLPVSSSSTQSAPTSPDVSPENRELATVTCTETTHDGAGHVSPTNEPNTSNDNSSAFVSSPGAFRRCLILHTSVPLSISSSATRSTETPDTSRCNVYRMRIKCSPKQKPNDTARDNLVNLREKIAEIQRSLAETDERTEPQPSTSSVETASSLKKQDGGTQRKSTSQLKRIYPGFLKKSNRRPVLDTSSDSSSEDEERRKKRLYSHRNFSHMTSSSTNQSTSSASVNVETSTSNSNNASSLLPPTTSTPSSNSQSFRPLSFNLLLKPYCSNAAGNVNSSSGSTAPSNASVVTTTTANVEPNESCARTTEISPRSDTEPCARTLMNTDTRTTNSTVYTPSGIRRRFFSQRFSAFYPTRVYNVRSQSRLRRSSSFQSASPTLRRIVDEFETFDADNNGLPVNLAPDEVVNYSERANSEDDPTEHLAAPPEFHPFDPPPDVPSINPENIGIGNMYSNIVQDLEVSLRNVRNIRASARPGETSDMLSSFSERLESIMHQSNSILRNLRNTMDMLPPNTRNADISTSHSVRTSTDRPQFTFNDPTFYVRDNSDNGPLGGNDTSNFSRSSVTTDHTYPRNPIENNYLRSPTEHIYPQGRDYSSLSPSGPENMTPLMTSLHLTISHIQRQAGLLRRQVESIERIDRAMLEVAQLQMIRQMFEELRRHVNTVGNAESRSGVSSVRQMMAGTRISDSSPYDSPNETNTDSGSRRQNSTSNQSTSEIGTEQNRTPSASIQGSRSNARKSYLPSRLQHLQRQNRRFSVVNFFPPRRIHSRDRLMRRWDSYRSFSARPSASRVESATARLADSQSSSVHLNAETLNIMVRRLEQLLTNHLRLVCFPPHLQPVPVRDNREHVVIERLNRCRLRLNHMLGRMSNSNMHPSYRIEVASATQDSMLRFGAREAMSLILNTFTRYFENAPNVNFSPSFRSYVRMVIDLSLLLSDILLLHIIDSIPPPTGMNLDPERESLSARIDQACCRMLQNRSSNQPHTLTRTLRVIRLKRTYNSRRNALMTSGSHSEGIRELLGRMNDTLQNMHTIRGMSFMPAEVPPPSRSAEVPVREWPRSSTNPIDLTNSDEDTETSFNNWGTSTNSHDANNTPSESYRSNDVTSTENNNESTNSPASQSRTWNVPTVHINDVPMSESSFSSWSSRVLPLRYRLSELRSTNAPNIFRPRFFLLPPLLPLNANPLESDVDDSQRDTLNDGDVVMAVTPNHRIQAWDISSGLIPDINDAFKNVVVSECKIHNDASVDISNDGNILVTLLPSGGYLNYSNRLGVYSLRWESLGQCLYITSFEQNAVSVSLSPLSRHLVVGLASRRMSIIPSERWTMAKIFRIETKKIYGNSITVLRDIDQHRDNNFMSLNCIRWLPISGQGLIYATNTGQLRILS